MGKKEIMRKASSSRMEGETPTGVPEVMEATGAPHEEATPSPPRRQETGPTVVPSTSGGPIPTTGITQTSINPMDALGLFVKSMRPDLDLSQTLARLAAELIAPKPVQLPTVLTPLPIAETTPQTTRTTEPPTKEQAKANPTPSTPITHPIKQPSTQPDIPPPPSHSISQALHTDSPPKSSTEKTTDPRIEEGIVGEQRKKAERGELMKGRKVEMIEGVMRALLSQGVRGACKKE